MNYKFPTITHIDQVRKAISGKPEFIEATREGFTVFNYTVNFPETFPEVTSDDEAILRECRGLIFCTEGKVLARRLHKFFNVNERAETKLENLDLSKSHFILEKLDGSMITPFMVGDQIRWGTKMGLTEVAEPVEQWVKQNPRYEQVAKYLIEEGCTPIFEWCSRKQRIVIDYPTDRLVLIAIRANDTGDYAKYSDLRNFAEIFNLDLVQQYIGSYKSMEQLVDETKGLNDQEGWVIRFEDGHMLKIKSDQYVTLHRAKSLLDNERDVTELVLNNAIDDLLPLLNDVDKDRLNAYYKSVWNDITDMVRRVNDLLKVISETGLSRKDFSLQYANENPTVRSTIFANWGQDAIPNQPIADFLKKNLGSKSSFERNLNVIKTMRWKHKENLNE